MPFTSTEATIPSRSPFDHLPDCRKEMLRRLVPGGALECPPLCRRPKPGSQLAVKGKPHQRLRKSIHVAGFHEESFTAILRQVRKVPRSPADDGQAESHRLTPDRPVRLARGGKDEDVGCRVERSDVGRGPRSVPDDAAGEVGVRKAGPHARRIPPVGRLVAGKVERPGIGWKSREGLEELEDAFPWQPVGDGEERGSAPVTKVLHRTCGRRGHISSGRNDSNPRRREPLVDELLREVVTRSEEDVRPPQRQPVERGLRQRAHRGMIDSAGRLVEDADQWNAETAHHHGRTGERSCDRVEKDRASAALLCPTKHRRPTESGEREGPLGK
jgi:hypothetical protein